MAIWRILYYLLEFYLFAASGALAYLSLRAWLVPGLSPLRQDVVQSAPRIAHFVRGLAFAVIALDAVIGAINAGAAGLRFGPLALLRLLGYAVVFSLLPPALHRRRKVWLAGALLGSGEILLWFGHHNGFASSAAHGVLPYIGLVCLDLGIAVLGSVITRALVRVRLLDRLVIAFAVFGLLLAQIVALSLLGMVAAMGFDLGGRNAAIVANIDRPLSFTLTAVLVTSALVGFFLARDLSAPVTRLAKALRAIGEGDLEHRVQLGGGNEEDEMHDLAREVNRMAQRLKAADALRAEFVSFASHELRSPLTSIQGFADTLLADPGLPGEDRREFYGIIHDESNRLLRLINELLDISRLQAGKELSLRIERFDSARHLQKVVQVMRSHTNRHTLKVTAPPGAVMIDGDPDKFDQILINLLSNAIKYSPDGGDIQAHLRDDQEDVSIIIKDSGIGMSPEQAGHVFDKFYRATDRTDPPGGADPALTQNSLMRIEGSGLGLYLTRALVEAHGGDIRVESELGKGSSFTVRIPRRAPAAPAPPGFDIRREVPAGR